MTSQTSDAAQEGWDDLFLNDDDDFYTDPTSDSGSDYEDIPYTSRMAESDSEDEEEVKPAIQLQNTQGLREKLQGNLKDTVKKGLFVFDSLGINLPIFLDALSWGDSECITDAKIRYERSTLVNSKELPGILR